ncbi:hypothetical protein Trco_003632 [Trichoderma cornu-damae]|uniref:Heterokaryon incompatibility domain-containing protein n=1 Tax=Trichoderma cornu-damae TaxID=654480 RepID=A0A9P8QLE8_9HYPO|nr:hypothetical protein Trco_003632 [Trichoderma cornu-damae]
MSVSLRAPIFFSPRVPVKRKAFLISQDVCRFCNHLKYCAHFEETLAREACFALRTQITGQPDNYWISIHTHNFLRDGDDVPDVDRLGDCRYCRLLYDALNLFFNDLSVSWVKDAMHNPSLRVHIHVQAGSPVILKCDGAVETYPECAFLRYDVELFCRDRGHLTDEDLPPMELVLPEPAGTPDDRPCEAFFRSSFHSCASTTGSMDQTYTTPNRLLYLDCDMDDVVLWETMAGGPGQPDIPDKIEYATLCHGWLDTDPRLPKLLTSNMDDWKEGLAISRLPRALQDAIRVCHLNDVHFLWVDALCILQDSERDRREQSPLTGHYFRDSILTIVPASAASPDEAFLNPPREDWITHEVAFAAPSGATATITLRRKYSRPASPSDAVDVSSARWVVAPGSFRRTGQLYRRDWCFQEIALGTRVIHFTSAGVVFECRRHTCSREPVRIYRGYRGYRRTDVFAALPQASRGHAEDAMWLEAVQIYTSRDPTSLRDRLGAISGLAAISEMGIHDQYVAGLWRSNLLRGLLWEVRLRPGQPKTSRITIPFDEQKAPSFSWASVDAKIVWRCTNELEFQALAKVVDVGGLLQTPHPCFDTEGAFVRLEGHLRRCQVSQVIAGAGGGHWQFAQFRRAKDSGDRPKRYPFVGDGPLVTVMGRSAARGGPHDARSPDGGPRSIEKRCEGAREPRRRSQTYLTRHHCEFRKKNMYGRKKTTGAAFVLRIGRTGEVDEMQSPEVFYTGVDGLVLTRSMRYPGAFERIGCIRNLPESLFVSDKYRQVVTLV